MKSGKGKPKSQKIGAPSWQAMIAMAQALLLLGGGAVWANDDSLSKYLEMDLAELLEVTITSVGKKPQSLAETAAAVYVIGREEIRRSGATSIPEALALAPGLHVARISAGKWAVSARGFGGYTSNKLLVLMDGRSLYTPAFSGTFWDAQHVLLDDVERIEVIRGPGGTIWGANAVNGVINIITKKAGDSQGSLAQGWVGSGASLGMAARQGFTLGESVKGRLYAMGGDNDGNLLRQGSLARQWGDDAHDDIGHVQSGFRFDGGERTGEDWTVQGDLYRVEGDQVVYPFWTAGPPYLSANYSDVQASGANLVASRQFRINGGDTLSIKSYYDYNSRRESYYHQTFNTYDLDLQYESALGQRHAVTTGLGYRFIDGRFRETTQVAVDDTTVDIFSAFLQDQILLLENRVWLTLGSKYEHNPFTGSEWQPSARLLWKVDEQQSLWTSVARAVRTPSIVERNGRVTLAAYPSPRGAQTLALCGNDAFASEILLAYEAGYRWQPAKQLSFDLSLFYNDYQDLYAAIPESSAPLADLQFRNAQEGNARGLEFVVSWQPLSQLSLQFTYSWLDLDIEYKQGVLLSESINSVTLVNAPEHQASLRASYDFSATWQTNLSLRYVDAFESRDAVVQYRTVAIAEQLYLDANLVYRPRKNLELMLAAQNLGNSGQLQYISELITPATEIDSMVYGKITWSF